MPFRPDVSVGNIVPTKDYSKVVEDGDCPHKDGGKFKREICGDGKKVLLACTADPKNHNRWLRADEGAIVVS